MCDLYNPCECLKPLKPRNRQLSVLLLDCWQREYDKRPYRNFKFDILDFEERMVRKFNYRMDFNIVVQFLQSRRICSLKMVGVDVVWHEFELLQKFVNSLYLVRYINLEKMLLPPKFFHKIAHNAPRMACTSLNLEGSPLTDDNVEQIRKFLLNTKILQSLNVASCSVTQYNFAILADGVLNCPTMRKVNFSRLIGDGLYLDTNKIAHTLSSLIWQFKLTEMTLRHCELLAHDMEIIAEYLADRRSTLKNLDVGCNRIGPTGLKYLFDALVQSQTMELLNVNSNGLGTHGGEEVAKYLSSNYHLVHLDITYNNIGANAMNLILTAMKKRIQLKKLKIWGNSFDKKSGTTLRRILGAGVVLQEWIDVTVTYDDVLTYYRVIPYY